MKNTIKLGDAELEPLNSPESGSTLAGRRMFLELVYRNSPQTALDLVSPFYLSDLPTDYRKSEPFIGQLTAFYLASLARPELHQSPIDDVPILGNVRITPIQALSRFLYTSNSKLQRLLKKSRKEWTKDYPNAANELIAATAYKELLPSWSGLETQPDAMGLRQSLFEWGQTHNLTDEWCMDFALRVLIEFKVACVDKHPFLSGVSAGRLFHSNYDTYLNEWSWRSWRSACFAISKERHRQIFDALSDIPGLETFIFNWREKNGTYSDEIKVEDYFAPYSATSEEFESRVEESFWELFMNRFRTSPSDLVGQLEHVTIELSRFRTDLRKYLRKCSTQNKNYGKPVVKKHSADLHFNWLVDYQLVGESYTQISKKYEKARTSVMDGVKETAQLLGLSLRKANKSGRPVGVKEKWRSHIVRKTRNERESSRPTR